MKLVRLIAISAACGLIIGFIDNLTDRNLAAVLGVSLILGGLVLLAKGSNK
jgi:Flp pilus assembly protein TadB